ncbi:hypothetical protein E2C01_062290 [Portunus trituberculatus]|uniref:Uncharacterized protein n=1 Tax=Portunus trituberculatus TaxID=210409 RepID=A0A5B7HGW3_PORTR|nr:hypothetical protein [Portunus trituberculatus]
MVIYFDLVLRGGMLQDTSFAPGGECSACVARRQTSGAGDAWWSCPLISHADLCWLLTAQLSEKLRIFQRPVVLSPLPDS